MSLLAIRTKTKRMMVDVVRLIVYESRSPFGGVISGAGIVIGHGVSVLLVAVRKRLLEFLTLEVDVRVEQKMAENNTGTEASTEDGEENVIVGWYVIHKDERTSEDYFRGHWVLSIES